MSRFGSFETGSVKSRRYPEAPVPSPSIPRHAERHQRRKDQVTSKINYGDLHDFARHVIHSTETLGVALDVVGSMIEQQSLSTASPDRAQYQRTRQSLHFQLQMLKSLKARSESIQLRLQNEINFVCQVRLLPLRVALTRSAGIQQCRSEPEQESSLDQSRDERRRSCYESNCSRNPDISTSNLCLGTSIDWPAAQDSKLICSV